MVRAYPALIAFLAASFAGVGAAYGATPKALEIQRITLSESEDGPGVPRDYKFAPGDSAYFSFQVAGYRAVGDEDPRVSITYTIEARDSAGIPIMEPASGKVDTTLDMHDKNWMPKVRKTILIPPHALTGEYTIFVALTDRVGVTDTKAKTTFEVIGHAVELSDKLAVKSFHFYRNENEEKPLSIAAYRPGDTIWARFDITGFKTGEKNAFEVGYGLEVLRPNGEVMFKQADGAVEKEAPFYPKRYVPAGLSLNLDKDIKSGEYTMVVLVSDKTGAQTAEAREKFTVE
jgi:hypothetical protein